MNLPQAAAQIASLAGGDIQMVFEVPVPFIGSLQRNPAVSIVEVKSPSFQPVTMASNQKPFDDSRVRLAMKHAVDREGIIKAVWQGHGVVGEDHPVPTVNPFWAATTPKHTYDVEKAKQLLAEAGRRTGSASSAGPATSGSASRSWRWQYSRWRPQPASRSR